MYIMLNDVPACGLLLVDLSVFILCAVSPLSPNDPAFQIHVPPTETYMDVVEEKPVPLNPIVGFLARIAPLMAVPILASMCYAGFYLTGLVYRQTYLNRFGVPETLFKSDASDYFVYAYMAVTEIFKNWTSLISSPWVSLTIAGIILLLGVEWICLRKLPKTKAAKYLSTALGRKAHGRRCRFISLFYCLTAAHTSDYFTVDNFASYRRCLWREPSFRS